MTREAAEDEAVETVEVWRRMVAEEGVTSPEGLMLCLHFALAGQFERLEYRSAAAGKRG